MLTTAMKAKKAADDAKAQMWGQMGLPDQARPGAGAAPAQPAPEPHHGPRGEARVARGEAENEGTHGHHAVPRAEDRAARHLRHARRPPHAPALHAPPTADGDWRAVTWGAHARQIRDVALFLASAGLKGGERACVFAPNRVEWMSAALGIQAAGGVMVPVYASSTAEQAAYVVEHSDARVVFVDTPALVARVLASVGRATRAVERIVLLDDALDVGEHRRRAARAGRDGPRRSRTSSASSCPWSRALRDGPRARPGGRRRLRAHDGRRLARSARDDALHERHQRQPQGRPAHAPQRRASTASTGSKCNAPLLHEGDVDLLWLPMSHIFGFGEACLGNTLGFTTYMVRPARRARAAARGAAERLHERARASGRSSPRPRWPSTDHRGAPREARARSPGGQPPLLPLGRRGPQARGEGVPLRARRPHHRGLRPHRDLARRSRSTAPTPSASTPSASRCPSVELKLAEDGEILARGPSVFGGYHKDPAATREAFTADGWFKTGDVGRFTDDGFLQIVDRKKDILVTAGGKNVPPANIEQRFADDPFIAHVVVYGDAKQVPRRRRVAERRRGRRAPRGERRDARTRARGRPGARAAAHRPGQRAARELRDHQALRRHGPAAHRRGRACSRRRSRCGARRSTRRSASELEALYGDDRRRLARTSRHAARAQAPARRDDARRRRARGEQVAAAALPAQRAGDGSRRRCSSCRRSSTGTTCSTSCPARASPSGSSRAGTTSTASTGGRPADEDRYLLVRRRVRPVPRARPAQDGARAEAHVLGYCMGGTLAAIHAAAHPERFASLVALAAPVRFAEAGMLGALDAVAAVRAASRWSTRLGNVPWQLLQSSFHMLRPTLNLAKLVHLHRPRVGRRVPRRVPRARDLGQRQRELPRRGLAHVGRGAVPRRRVRARRLRALGTARAARGRRPARCSS